MSETKRAIVTDAEHGLRLDRALHALFPAESRSFLAKLVDQGHVTVNTSAAGKTSQRVEIGDVLELTVPDAAATGVASQDLPLTIVHEDDDIVVLDKPAGIVVHPAAGHADGTLVNALLFHVRDLSGIGGELRPGIVHRLDKDTSGLLVVAKNDLAHRTLTAAWNTAAIRKEYLAVVYGTPASARGTIEAAIGRDPRDRKKMAVVADGRNATTDYTVVEQLRYASVLRCSLRTGRTHQIRVHLKHLGHPIIGDPAYAGPQWRGIPNKRLQRMLAGVGRQMLHSARLTIPHPRTHESLTFEAPMPEDMRAVVEALREG
ncbi:MAG: RluA family pseudouridine synthase [Thermoanaerobaculia bacterium]